MIKHEIKVEFSNSEILKSLIEKAYFQEGDRGKILGKENYIKIDDETNVDYIIFKGLNNATVKIYNEDIIDGYLQSVCICMLASAGIAMAFFYWADMTFLHHLSFILWGIGFGALVTLFQTAVTRQVTEGTAIATSLQSAAFNFSIMIGSTVGGGLLANGSSAPIVMMALILLAAGIVISLFAKRTLA